MRGPWIGGLGSTQKGKEEKERGESIMENGGSILGDGGKGREGGTDGGSVQNDLTYLPHPLPHVFLLY
jgi:hypothetical protein